MLSKKNNSKLSFTTLPTYVGIITATIGFLVLIGWQFDVAILKTVITGTVSMKPNTALGFLIAGLLLLFLKRSSLVNYTVVRLCSLVIIMLGLLTLFEYFLGWKLGIDEFLFFDIPNAIQTSHQGRMSPNTALNFLLIGSALFTFSFRKSKYNFFVLLLLIFPLSISVIGLLGYLTGSLELTGLPAYTKMAFSTSVSFIILSIGIIFIFYKDKNIPFRIEQKIFFGLTVVGSLIIFVSILSISSIQSLLSLSKLLANTHQTETNIQQLNSEVTKIVAIGRRFLISGDEKYFKHWYEAKEDILKKEDTIKKLEWNYLKNREELTTLDQLVKERIDYSELLINNYKKTGHKTSDTMLTTLKDKQFSDKIEKIILTMIDEEDKLITKITNDEFKQANTVKQVIFTSFGINVFFLLSIFVFFKKDITGRRRAEKKLQQFNRELEERVKERTAALRENEARLLKAQQITHLGFLDWDLKTNKIICSDEVFKLYGIDKNDNPISLEKIFKGIYPDDLEYVKNKLESAARGEKNYNIDHRILHPDGKIIWVNAQGHLQLDTDGNPKTLLGTIVDITQRKLKEEKLKQNEERLDLFFNQSLDGFFFRMLDEPVIWNDIVNKEKTLDYVINHLRITKINSAMLEQYGATEKDFIGLTINDLDFIDIKYPPRQRLKDLFDKGRLHIDTKEKKKDGTDIIIEGNYICLYDSEKRITGYFGVQRDVTILRNAEIELEKNKNELQDFFDEDISGNFISTPDGRLLRCNKTFLKIYGFKSKKDALNFSVEKFYRNQAERNKFVDIIRNKKYVNLLESESYTYDGREINILENVVGIFNNDGKLIKMRGHIIDITERTKAQEEIKKYREHLEELVDEKTEQLAEQNNFLKTLLDTIPNPVFILNKDRKITLVNKSFENFFEIKRDFILGKSTSNIIPSDVEKLSKEYDKKLLMKYDSVVYESYVIINKSGKIPVMIFKSSYGSKSLKPQGITCLIVDISKQKKMAEHTLEALKKEKELNEMKTNFISMASHEFRTPLTTILASADLLDMFHNNWDEEKNISHIKKIQNSVLYMTSLLNDVLAMSRSDHGKMSFNPSLINLDDFCTEIIEQTKPQAYPNHNIIYQYKLPYQNAKIDPKLLNHILTNLLTNALKFSPDGGDVVLSVEDMEEFIKFGIKDKGIGISKDEINKLFEPFFRGKNSSNIEGTGLGLSIVKRYVELHEGEISVDSKLGKGTQFYIKIKKQ